ncbi:MAG TPA: ATP-binding protein [Ktedonobacterales bacterium]|nr:ATP-binding protein [Ktedonobacterales bacterium]
MSQTPNNPLRPPGRPASSRSSRRARAQASQPDPSALSVSGAPTSEDAGADAPHPPDSDPLLSRELHLSQALVEAAIAHLDLNTLLPALLGPIKDVMGVDNVAILLLAAGGKTLVVRAANGPEAEVVGQVTVPLGKGFAGRIAASRQMLVVPDLAAFDAVNPLLGSRIRSAAGVPLLLGDRLLGVLHIDTSQPHTFTPQELALLQRIADHVALAIDRALLYQAERDSRLAAEHQSDRTRRALNALLELAEAIVSFPASPPSRPSVDDSADEPIRQLIALCAQVLDCNRIAVIALDSASERLRIITVSGSPPPQVRDFRAGLTNLRLGDRFPPDVVAQLQAGEAVLLDVNDLPPDDPARALSQGHFLLAPLRADGSLTGYLGVNFGDSASDYTTDNRALAQATAQLVGLVMERQRLAHEREEARANALSSERAKRQMDEFLSIAGHELRTPITSAKANVQIVTRSLERLLQTYARADARLEANTLKTLQRAHSLLQRTDRQFIRQERLINDLLDTSRIAADKLAFHFAPCDLADLARDSVEEQQIAHPERTISLSAPARPLIIRADADRLIQVTDNLLTNALKYSPPGAHVAVCLRLEGALARCEVQDHGVGLPPQEQERIWRRFYRVPGVDQQEGAGIGLGLGLFISKTIVERHGGQIGVESAPGKGSTFWFTLPLASPDTPAELLSDLPPDE